MTSLKDQIADNSGTTASCLSLTKKIKPLLVDPKRVAFLSNFTINGLPECLQVKAFGHDISLDFFIGEYDQWQQAILSEDLYKFDPNLIFLVLDHFPLSTSLFFDYFDSNIDQLSSVVDEKLLDLIRWVDKIKSRTTAKIVINSSVGVYPTPMGIFDSKLSLGYQDVINTFNRRVVDQYRQDRQVFVFDLDSWLGGLGKNNSWYGKYFFMADMRLSPELFPQLADEMLSFIIPVAGKTRKCLVLDLDNTLWGGVIGEDGVSGLRLSSVGDGQEFYYLQRAVLAMRKRGVILAINSKNNEGDVKEVFQDHPGMLLSMEDFSCVKINWENKVDNMRAIANELNIGLDSLVFMDDDPANRQLIRSLLPQVDVLDLSSGSSDYLRTLLSYKGFNTFEFTEEDKKRPLMYYQDSQRKILQSGYTDMTEFLEDLQLRVSIRIASPGDVMRISQLTKKTNQFNLTTQRYSEEEIVDLLRGGAYIWVLEVEDRFGDYGITGVCIIKDCVENWEIDTLLLSCRVLGKKIEEQFLGFILENLKTKKIIPVIAKYIPTAKNTQVKDFYNKFNFIKTSLPDCDIWRQDLASYIFKPHHFISII